jgi:hypothetical protein
MKPQAQAVGGRELPVEAALDALHLHCAVGQGERAAGGGRGAARLEGTQVAARRPEARRDRDVSPAAQARQPVLVDGVPPPVADHSGDRRAAPGGELQEPRGVEALGDDVGAQAPGAAARQTEVGAAAHAAAEQVGLQVPQPDRVGHRETRAEVMDVEPVEADRGPLQPSCPLPPAAGVGAVDLEIDPAGGSRLRREPGRRAHQVEPERALALDGRRGGVGMDLAARRQIDSVAMHDERLQAERPLPPRESRLSFDSVEISERGADDALRAGHVTLDLSRRRRRSGVEPEPVAIERQPARRFGMDPPLAHGEGGAGREPGLLSIGTAIPRLGGGRGRRRRQPGPGQDEPAIGTLEIDVDRTTAPSRQRARVTA